MLERAWLRPLDGRGGGVWLSGPRGRRAAAGWMAVGEGEEGRRGGLWWEMLGQPAALASASWRAALGRSRPPVGSGDHSSHGRAWRESPPGRGQVWRGLRKEPARQPGRAASYPEVLSQEGRGKAVARLRQQGHRQTRVRGPFGGRAPRTPSHHTAHGTPLQWRPSFISAQGVKAHTELGAGLCTEQEGQRGFLVRGQGVSISGSVGRAAPLSYAFLSFSMSVKVQTILSGRAVQKRAGSRIRGRPGPPRTRFRWGAESPDGGWPGWGPLPRLVTAPGFGRECSIRTCVSGAGGCSVLPLWHQHSRSSCLTKPLS